LHDIVVFGGGMWPTEWLLLMLCCEHNANFAQNMRVYAICKMSCEIWLGL